jgi:peroxiredoxin Q/BCP
MAERSRGVTMTDGDLIPDMDVTAVDGSVLSLRSFAGRPLVLFIYPKDDTAGCTREAIEFSTSLPRFAAAGAAVLGLSKDSPAKHAKFAAKHDLSVPLASDEEGRVIVALGSWGEKTLYGRKYMGIDRSTFLFDREGRLVRVWRKVRVPGHVEEVLAAVEAL